MCERCADLDYQVADCWRPCYVPRARPKGFIPVSRGFSDEDFDAQNKINNLMAIIRGQRAEISTLKATQTKDDSRDSFEGVE